VIDSTLAGILTGSGACGVFCVLFIVGLVYPRQAVTDLKTENAALKADRDAQRDRADTAVAAAVATRDLMAAIQAGITMGRAPQPAGNLGLRGGP